MARDITLITGGVRSGKSAFAERLIPPDSTEVFYMATGVASDEEMHIRVQRHQARRPSHWVTLEEPMHIVSRLENELSNRDQPNHILLDSLDVWISNLLLYHETLPYLDVEQKILSEIDQLITICKNHTGTITIVSSEVGLSLVSSNKLGRYFQDLLGIANQNIATVADKVYLIISGLPLQIKNVG
ncbi:MAG: bifunctional adenosylcobinamide kinase/adenosylcobinamide-phosphate guanylyltransferase [Dehalococcoidia bacterium]|nr:bifunctional adenosylcobinamide kinase/adenosylcobinamide-phosphate guanylyltransferase [Dehalococcoidia bacterium]|tara:strand:+ start:3472 stop:4029 length:558 start_codon:yes stop_codon:yes gene_type:complete